MSRTQPIFSGKVVKLTLHEITLPDGSTAVRELIEHQGAVGVIALDDAQQVLLVRQFRIGAGRDLYEIPAGILEAGEAPEDCATRELREEVGYRPGRLEALGGFFTAAGYTTEYIHLFLAQDLIAAPLPPDHDEFVEQVRLPLTEALALVDQGEIVDSKSLIALLRIARRLGL